MQQSGLNKALCWLLIGVGLLQPVIFIFGTARMRMYAMTTGAAPLPTVFSSIGDKQTYRRRFTIELGARRRKSRSFEAHAGFWRDLPGPFAYKGALMLSIAHGNTTPVLLRDAVWDYAFCRSREVLDAIGYKGRPDLVIVYNWDVYDGREKAMGISHFCRSEQ